MNWLKTIVAVGKRGYAWWRRLPPEDRAKIEQGAKKLSKRVLKK